jgi:NAD(P)-dependent dehydrogenase (short-subunit alcohol dehydrogenase family)
VLLEALQGALRVPVESYACDVTDAAAVTAAAADFVAKHGAPDIVIGNAGISHGNLTEIAGDVATFRETLEINVIGLVNTFHPFIAPMRARGSGSLAGIASVAGFRGLPGATAYSASKAAAIRYLEGLRVELRGSGVLVTTICPGFIATAMTQRNPYRMPFIIEADDAARRFARAIDSGTSYAVIPWQMAIAGRILGVLPDFIYDAFAARRERKPRKGA